MKFSSKLQLILISILVVNLAACSANQPIFSNTPTGNVTPSATAAQTNSTSPTLPAVREAGCVPTDTERQVGTVTKVIDGDTIDVDIDGTVYKVRYIGMNAPEVSDPAGSAATQLNSSLVKDQTVLLIKDVSETDKYGRLLRYIFVGDTFVNYELVIQGEARAGTWKPDTACDAEFKLAQQSAQAAGLGIWATATATAIVSGTAPMIYGLVSSGCPQGCTEHISGCDIKGNISSEKIYHLPGQENYDQTVISPEKGERWFCTEAEAVANGWRKAQR